MAYFLKANLYEIQTILFWILGVLILDGSGHWSGWVAIGYGWFTFVYTIWFVFAHKKEIQAPFIKS